jgi:hypothetical protein
VSDVFVSYSHSDERVAERLSLALEREGFGVWGDVAIRPGEVLAKATERALGESRVVLVL